MSQGETIYVRDASWVSKLGWLAIGLVGGTIIGYIIRDDEDDEDDEDEDEEEE